MKQRRGVLLTAVLISAGIVAGCRYVAPPTKESPQASGAAAFSDIGWSFPVGPAAETTAVAKKPMVLEEPLRTPVLTQFSPLPPLPNIAVREVANERPRQSLNSSMSFTAPVRPRLIIKEADVAAAGQVAAPAAPAVEKPPAAPAAPTPAAPFTEIPRWNAEVTQ